MQQMEVGLDDAMVVILSDVQLDKPMVHTVHTYIYILDTMWNTYIHTVGAGKALCTVSRLRGG
jgi:hypothetical protein